MEFQQANRQAKQLFKRVSEVHTPAQNYQWLSRAITVSQHALHKVSGCDSLVLLRNLSIYYFRLIDFSVNWIQFFQKGFYYASEAFKKQGLKQKQWYKNLVRLVVQKWKIYFGRFILLERQVRIQNLFKIFHFFDNDQLDQLKSLLAQSLVKALYMEAKLLQQNQHAFKKAYQIYQQCLQFIRFQDRLKKSVDLEFDQVKTDLQKHKLRCQSLIEFLQIVNFKNEIFNQTPQILFDEIWGVIDKFKLLSENIVSVDPDISVKALMQVAQIYKQIIRDFNKSLKYYGMAKQIIFQQSIIEFQHHILFQIQAMIKKVQQLAKINVVDQKSFIEELKIRLRLLMELKPRGVVFFANRLKQAFVPIENIDSATENFKKKLNENLQGKQDKKIIRRLKELYHPDNSCQESNRSKMTRRQIFKFVNNLESQLNKLP